MPRSIWKGAISFGLVHIPVELYPAESQSGLDLDMLDRRDFAPIGYKRYNKETGKDIAWKKAKATEVQIDHVVPLSYAWQMGASRWSKEKRQQLANDVLNLLPVSGSTNSAKRDSGPASWLPPNTSIRCSYAVRFAQVAEKYELPVTAPDKRMMLEQCGG